ncbi:MAG: BON domain-containing protein [Pseudomonadota bacterium]
MSARLHPSLHRAVTGLCFLIGIAALAACGSSRSAGANIDDVGANSTLKRVLLFDRQHDYGDVDITVFEGRVMLTGTMRSPDGQSRLVENAFKASNVVQVIDETVLAERTSIGQGLEDSRIDRALKTKLLTDRGVTSRNYKVAVSNGVIYLLGVARDEVELGRVLNLATSTSGVRRVVSHILYQDDPSRYTRSYN